MVTVMEFHSETGEIQYDFASQSTKKFCLKSKIFKFLTSLPQVVLQDTKKSLGAHFDAKN